MARPHGDRRLLAAIIERFDGGPVGVESLAAAIGEEHGTVEEVIGPFLTQQGFVMRTLRRRMATRSAYLQLGLAPAEGPIGELQVGGALILEPAEARPSSSERPQDPSPRTPRGLLPRHLSLAHPRIATDPSWRVRDTARQNGLETAYTSGGSHVVDRGLADRGAWALPPRGNRPRQRLTMDG